MIYLQVKQLKGINWNVGAVGNATWTGVRLCDVLKDLGINEDEFNHVQVQQKWPNFHNIAVEYKYIIFKRFSNSNFLNL